MCPSINPYEARTHQDVAAEVDAVERRDVLKVPEEAGRERQLAPRHVDEAAVDAEAREREGLPDDELDLLAVCCVCLFCGYVVGEGGKD